MTLFSEIKDQLAEPFPEVAFRVGSTREKDGRVEGKPLGYINAAQVINLLNEHCPDEWEDEYVEVRPGVLRCRLTICGVTREGVGMAGSDDEEADKSAESDALKRAACKFGIGLYLRNWDLPYTPLESVYTNKRGKKSGYLPWGYQPPTSIPLKTRKVGKPGPQRQAPASQEPPPPLGDDGAPGPAPTDGYKKATPNQVVRIKNEITKRHLKSPDQVEVYLKRCGVDSIEALPYTRASQLITALAELPPKATVKA